MDYSHESESEIRERCREERRQIVQKYDRGREDGNQIDDWEDPKFEMFHMQDRYGFIHDKRLPDVSKRSERERKQIEVERSRSKKWVDMIGSKDPVDPKESKRIKKYFETGTKHREVMIKRIFKGVPESVRGRLWYLLLGIKELKEQQEGVYARMKDIARRHSPDIRQIDLDVNRTYRDHIMFRERYNSRQNALFHVLAAYSVYNTEVGYCQGMSQIAALLLMYLTDEEDAFWALHKLMIDEKYAMHGFFIHGFPKLLRFQAHHDKVMRAHLRPLKKHLDKQGIDTGIYTLKWFFQCFLDRIPFSLTLRVWDIFLLEGDRILIAMAHTILYMHRKKLINLQMDEAIEYLQIRLAKDFGYDDDSVIFKLREKIYLLRSGYLDHPGKPPQDETPGKPFGLVDFPENESDVEIPEEKKPKEWTIEKEAGLRTGFTEKEREFSQNAILRQQQANHNVSLDDMDDDFDEENGGGSYDDSSHMRPLRSTSTAGGGPADFDTSFDASDIIPNNGSNDQLDDDDDDDVVHFIQGTGKSPLPPSEAQDELDNTLRFMLKSASEIHGDRPGTAASDKLPSATSASANRRPRSQYSELATGDDGNRKKMDTSFESYFGVERSASNSDVVRIRVPYSRDDALKSKSIQQREEEEDENKITINVSNHHQQQQQQSNGASKKYHRASLEESFKSKLTTKNHATAAIHSEIKSNSKSMTNL